jgi:polyketide cyclase/dehydrase/lipid transport protein
MASAENSVVIGRSRPEVFAFVADHGNDPQWRPGVADIKRASGEGQGAIYTQGVKGLMGRRIDADFEVTAYQPDTLLAFRTLAGPVRPEGSYRFEDADGGTRVTLSLNATLSGMQKLMSPMVSKSMRNEVAALGNLKRVLES